MSCTPHLVSIDGGRSATKPDTDENEDDAVALQAADEAAWTRAWEAGPKAVVRRAFDRYYDMVFVTALRLVGNQEDAADVSQVVFETLLQHTAQVRDPEKIGGFLKACAVRRGLMFLRRRRWWHLPRGRKALAAEAARFETERENPSLVAAARELLAGLPPEERAVVVLKCVEEHSYDEIAELLEMSVATVRRRLATARTRAIRHARGPAQRNMAHNVSGQETP